MNGLQYAVNYFCAADIAERYIKLRKEIYDPEFMLDPEVQQSVGRICNQNIGLSVAVHTCLNVLSVGLFYTGQYLLILVTESLRVAYQSKAKENLGDWERCVKDSLEERALAVEEELSHKRRELFESGTFSGEFWYSAWAEKGVGDWLKSDSRKDCEEVDDE